MNISPMKLAEIARVAEQVREMLGDDLDAETFTDTVDGETDAMDIIGALIKADAEADAMKDANKALAAVYVLRAKTMDERKAHIRAALVKVMDALGEKTLRHPLGTLTAKMGKPEILGEPDPETLPDNLVRVKRTANITAIREELEAGREVPGVVLGNAAPSLAIRRA